MFSQVGKEVVKSDRRQSKHFVKYKTSTHHHSWLSFQALERKQVILDSYISRIILLCSKSSLNNLISQGLWSSSRLFVSVHKGAKKSSPNIQLSWLHTWSKTHIYSHVGLLKHHFISFIYVASMLFVLNLLSVLMREPIIEGNAPDHALFCKYAAELLERVTGKSLATSSAVPSLFRIKKVWTWNWHELSSHAGKGETFNSVFSR